MIKCLCICNWKLNLDVIIVYYMLRPYDLGISAIVMLNVVIIVYYMLRPYDLGISAIVMLNVVIIVYMLRPYDLGISAIVMLNVVIIVYYMLRPYDLGISAIVMLCVHACIQVFYVAGAIAGGLLSATMSGSFGSVAGVSPISAFVGGMCMLLGARTASGCTRYMWV